jgi:hypothetical protein
MRSLFIFIILFGFISASKAQEKIISRTIFIGDAGELDSAQARVIRSAANHILQEKTTVVFLGDNIYPGGMSLPGTANREYTRRILQSQFDPMRAKGAKVYFLPGNHDWDHSGRHGQEKVRAAWKFISDRKDSSLAWLPPKGGPDPQEIHISVDITLIVFDSEWWLFPYRKENDNTGCKCNTAGDVLKEFERIRNNNPGKVIFLASHHPFLSYGNHGGHFYFPVPVLGSLYAIVRTLFPAREDLRHPRYRMMIRQIDSVFSGSKNLFHIAGHEHGLQFIDRHGYAQVVSGSGAKHSHVVKGKFALFSDASPGYVIVDELSSQNIRFTYIKVNVSGVLLAFEFLKHYIR